MKNPFQKKTHRPDRWPAAAGGSAGVALGWLYLTDSGAQYRNQLTRKAKKALSNIAAELIDKKIIVPKKIAKKATDTVIKDKR